MNCVHRPIIAITMGDAGGIGPEVIAKALSDDRVKAWCRPVLIGSCTVFDEINRVSGLSLKIEKVSSIDEVMPDDAATCILETEHTRLQKVKKAHVDVAQAKAAMSSVKTAVELALQNTIHGIVTAPITKEGIAKAGFTCPGHTEYLAELTQTETFGMMFIGGGLKVILVTIHMGLREIFQHIQQDKILETIQLAAAALREYFGRDSPRIGVAGVNPHAGEQGMFGKEEIREIIPAIEMARQKGLDVHGPVPPDIIYYKALHGAYDVVVSMYHDQGLIPIKLIAYESGVNLTVGLPITRTSPDHGTAYDIAWKGNAHPGSMIEAIRIASEIAKRRMNQNIQKGGRR